MFQPAGPADVFAEILNRIIHHEGGSGNIGQLRVRFRSPVTDVAGLENAWKKLGQHCWIIGGRWRSGLRGIFLSARGPAALQIERASSIDAIATAQLHEGMREQFMRLTLADDGVVLTWDHRLCDARGAGGTLALLTDIAAGKPLQEKWWDTNYRWPPGVPRAAQQRGPMAQQAMKLLIPHRLVKIWRPLPPDKRTPANSARPLFVQATTLRGDDNTLFQNRQRQASGRMAETPFLLACVAAALEQKRGVDGDILMPLTVDMRESGDKRLFANCHGYCFLRVPAGLASKDLKAAATHLKQAHREWLAADGLIKLSASMSWFGHIPTRLARSQLGNHQAGVWASCVVANAGATPLSATWFGAEIDGVDHAACIPANPGIGVLFRRDARGFGFDTITTGRINNYFSASEFAQALRYQLLERPISEA
jgi:hypothetical protein